MEATPRYSSRTWDTRNVTFLHGSPFFSADGRRCRCTLSTLAEVKSALLAYTEKHDLINRVEQQYPKVNAESPTRPSPPRCTAPRIQRAQSPFQKLLSAKNRWVPCAVVCNPGTAWQAVVMD